MSPPEDVHLWQQNVVDGHVTFLTHGEICMLYTGSGQPAADALLSEQADGKPVELTRPQAHQLAEMIMNALGDS